MFAKLPIFIWRLILPLRPWLFWSSDFLLLDNRGNILLSRLTPYAEEIIGDHQSRFRRNRSTANHIFSIRHILEEKWEYNEAVHQLFIDFKKAYDSVRRAVLYNILIEFGIPVKLVRLIKMCLSETYSRVRVGKHLSDTFPINPLKTKRVCFIQGLSAYRAVNTLHFGYKNQSLNVL
jgi:hypothetical protein